MTMQPKHPHLEFQIVCLLLLLSLAGPALPATPELVLSQPLTLRWVYGSERTTNFTPATDAKSVYLPLADGTLVALNASDGKLRWKTDSGGTFSASPAADETTLYVATEYPTADKSATRGTLRALSKDTGITLWMRTLQAPRSEER